MNVESTIYFEYHQLTKNDSLDFEVSEEQMIANQNDVINTLKRLHEIKVKYENKQVPYWVYKQEEGDVAGKYSRINFGIKFIYNPKLLG